MKYEYTLMYFRHAPRVRVVRRPLRRDALRRDAYLDETQVAKKALAKAAGEEVANV